MVWRLCGAKVQFGAGKGGCRRCCGVGWGVDSERVEGGVVVRGGGGWSRWWWGGRGMVGEVGGGGGWREVVVSVCVCGCVVMSKRVVESG